MHPQVIKYWFRLKRVPPLETILRLCYVCEVTPLQIMRGEASPFVEAIIRGTPSRPPVRRRTRPKVDNELVGLDGASHCPYALIIALLNARCYAAHVYSEFVVQTRLAPIAWLCLLVILYLSDGSFLR